MSKDESKISTSPLSVQKLLIANRGEVAVRIIKSAKKLGIRTVAVYTQVDATSAHVLLADEAIALTSSTLPSTTPDSEPVAINALAYLDAKALLKACRESDATMVHPGYGFLSENAEFASLVEENGLKFLGPSTETITKMGLKHRARAIAKEAEVPIVPGSDGLVDTVEEACRCAIEIGYPVMLKASAGGGGMGLIVCKNEADLRLRYTSTQERAKNLFHNPGLFIERYFESSRHIEVQIFGDGKGLVIHFGERECSVQRRHQKIIEEAPSPFLLKRPKLQKEIWDAALRLAQSIAYKSAGTVEFIVDERTEEFFFLEMNTRLQVEHGVTEMLYSGLDIVALMIFQGLSEIDHHSMAGVPFLDQVRSAVPDPRGHAIEARLYCENPANDFRPTPGVLQNVSFPEQDHLTRVDSWVSSGTSISPFYDPLIAKVIVLDMTRYDAIKRLSMILGETYDESENTYGSVQTVVVQGPANNMAFLRQILNEEVFRNGNATTQWIDSGGITFTPNAFTIMSPGISASVQSLPIRDIGIGVPPSGPMDPMALQVANILVGNAPETEGIEIVVPPPAPNLTKTLAFVVQFHVEAIVAVSGAAVTVSLDNQERDAWRAFIVPAGSKLMINGAVDEAAIGGGSRAYLSVSGGLPGIPEYLGSKSTSMGFGGYQGRELQRGDMLDISSTVDIKGWNPPLIQKPLIPSYPSKWTLFALPGPHDDEQYITREGIESFYARRWRVGSASNRMGIRLEPVSDDGGRSKVIDWARESGGEGGSHPSNILDNGYARGSVNLNGDTPVILTPEGPDMGGYICVTTIATADQWKLGQIRPGDEVQFSKVSHKDAMALQDHNQQWLDTVLATASGFNAAPLDLLSFQPVESPISSSILHQAPATATRPEFLIRQAGDAALLTEFGEMKLDFSIRARVHALELKLKEMCVPGIKRMCPCIRSTMIHYDPFETSQEDVLEAILAAEEMLPEDSSAMQFPGRKLTFPTVLDDKWNKEALKRYMQSMRDQAVYLPSNIDYLARNNGLEGGEEALKLLVQSPWLVFGVGFYLSCPFLVPIDPRCRLIGQKMNPSRTFTPRGAIGIAGPVAAIYPVESPGGYQLYGRTLPTWQGWGRGKDFSPSKPWLLEPFDQVVFEVISEDDYAQLEKDFDNGRYVFKIENVVFSMKEYNDMVDSLQSEIDVFKERQRQGSAKEEARENELLKEWQERKKAIPATKVTSQSEVTPHFVSSPLSGSLWKVKCAIGDVVEDPDQVLVILEAMKTEIPIVAGEDVVGMKVSSIALTEGELIKSGDRLVYFVS